MSATMSPGPALQCVDCDAIVPVSGNPADGDDCPACGSTATTAVRIEECPAGDTCGDDDHHWGIGMHVSEDV